MVDLRKVTQNANSTSFKQKKKKVLKIYNCRKSVKFSGLVVHLIGFSVDN